MQDDESASPRNPSDQIIERIASWPHVELAKGRFNSTSFQVVGREFGHLHPRLADIGYPKPLRDQLIKEGQTKEHHVVPNSNATTFHIESADDADHVVWLFRLSYLARLAVLQRREELDADLNIQQELDELAPSDGIRTAFEAAIAA
ncbi:luciferase family protein [Natrinema gelatinilyticum]|uniref:luciferase domain-containing protein n=1 Tax=Natrinema gelatinilyticum TaxID=2961571 RepID=UPI0020C35DF0|nr:luciferase family protein [Natrinema gelatinilyticum]